MIMENDTLQIPKRYLQMSASEGKAEEEKMLHRILAQKKEKPDKPFAVGLGNVKINL